MTIYYTLSPTTMNKCGQCGESLAPDHICNAYEAPEYMKIYKKDIRAKMNLTVKAKNIYHEDHKE